LRPCDSDRLQRGRAGHQRAESGVPMTMTSVSLMWTPRVRTKTADSGTASLTDDAVESRRSPVRRPPRRVSTAPTESRADESPAGATNILERLNVL